MGYLAKAAQLRYQIARIAAQYMMEHGIDDFEAAKKRAVKNLSAKKVTVDMLPSSQEIHQAILEYKRLFASSAHETHLKNLRQIAYHAMLLLKSFSPTLTGRVLDGSATKSSTIQLHAFADPCELIMIHLINHEIAHKAIEKNIQLHYKKAYTIPGFQFSLRQTIIEVFVFPEDSLKFQARCPISGGMMPRADLQTLGELLQI